MNKPDTVTPQPSVPSTPAAGHRASEHTPVFNGPFLAESDGDKGTQEIAGKHTIQCEFMPSFCFALSTGQAARDAANKLNEMFMECVKVAAQRVQPSPLNAEQITACNQHEQLVADRTALLAANRALREILAQFVDETHNLHLKELARAALSLGKGEGTE